MNHQETSELIAGFLSNGGQIQKLPEALPASAEDVVKYLHGRDVAVEPAPGRPGEPRFTHNGEVVDLKTLVQIANRMRRRQRMPPFEVEKPQRR